MVAINSTNLRTAGELSEELDITSHKVKSLLEGVKPVIASKSGRLAFYDIDDVKKALYRQHGALFQFMGYLSPEQSYDMVTETDA